MASRVDTKLIEQRAVDAVRGCFYGVNNICPYIAENDRTECTDGYLQLYASNELTAESLTDKIDVQVKGTASKRKSEAPKFPVKLVDLRQFRRLGGALYFVVYEKERSCEVYYVELLPFDIDRILVGCGDQKTKKLRLRPFPTDPAEVERLVSRAIKDKVAQRPGVGYARCSMDEYKANGLSFPEHSFTVDLKRGESLSSLAPYRHGVYVYGKSNGLLFPIQKIENLVSVAVGSTATVSAGGVSFETEFFSGENEEGEFYKFDAFEFDLAKSVVRFKEAGPLSVRLRDLMLMRELRNTGVFSVNGLALTKDFAPNDKDQTIRLDERIEALAQLQAVVDILHIKVDFDPCELTEQNLRDMCVIYHALVEGEPLHYGDRGSGICLTDMAGFIVKTILIKKDDGAYELMDALDIDTTRMVTVIVDENGKPLAPVPPLLIQTEDELVKLGNIDPGVFKETCKRIPVEETIAEVANERMLTMLKAFDRGAVCAGELLDCCEILVELLEPYSNEDITGLNRLQIKARRQGLSEDDDRLLAGIIASSDDKFTRTGAAILRGDKAQVSALVDKMSPEEQVLLQSWPISHFLSE